MLECFFFDETQLPGVARRLLTFLASPRKVSKRRRPHSRCPSGSRLCRAKNGKRAELASLAGRPAACKRLPFSRHGAVLRETPASPQTTPISLSIFCTAQTAASQRKEQARLTYSIAEPNMLMRVMERTLFKSKKTLADYSAPVHQAPDAAGEEACRPAVTMPVMLCRKWIKK
ncbi:hypothetical protein HEAR0994 [Herminiimonas arsenicoxydans]|uniref:Uncharacterized protein n=1 Tax=Herminiimonas arsenicoxydans TaxID=204773 RepID=A4G3T9_HERAR|nr:hypothetical protein HEAR0994 [Herminiimonas arsenicoxydans]